MREFIKLVENADFDFGHRDASELHTMADRGQREFSDKGRADVRSHINNPRFGDNSMGEDNTDIEITVEEDQLNEFMDNDHVEMLHDMLRNAGVTDQEIKMGVRLSREGYMKVAAHLGVSPEDVEVDLNTLMQNLRDQDKQDDEMLDGEISLGEAYRRFMEGTNEDRPFDEAAGDHYSYEDDALGSVTVRDDDTGDSKFYQGGAANELLAKLRQPGVNKDAVLAPMVEFADPEADDDVSSITPQSGSYNFPWKLGGQHGLATAFFSVEGDHPRLEVVSVTDSEGNEVDMPHMDELLQQARNFIPEA